MDVNGLWKHYDDNDYFDDGDDDDDEYAYYYCYYKIYNINVIQIFRKMFLLMTKNQTVDQQIKLHTTILPVIYGDWTFLLSLIHI